jgi:hypothetical protein
VHGKSISSSSVLKRYGFVFWLHVVLISPISGRHVCARHTISVVNDLEWDEPLKHGLAPKPCATPPG